MQAAKSMKKTPHYKTLYHSLRDSISRGVFKEGDLLPSENELSQLHKVTRNTVRQALTLLVSSGYIKKHKGKGSIITIPSTDIGILSIHGTSIALQQYDLQTKIVKAPVVKKWDSNFFFPLSESEKAGNCIQLDRIRLVNQEPVFYDITYLPNINLPRFCTRNFENKSLFDLLRRIYHIEVTGGKQRFKAIKSDEKMSRHLKIKAGSPILHLERKIETSREGFVFYSSLFCNTELYSLLGRF